MKPSLVWHPLVVIPEGEARDPTLSQPAQVVAIDRFTQVPTKAPYHTRTFDTCAHIYRYIDMDIYIYMYMYICIYVYMYMYICNMYMYMYFILDVCLIFDRYTIAQSIF